ncbi:MAG: hypothetical protein NC204_05745 [Candidatus Amulumruptor caecigallinarius]|nr:hypothetical protein [Candidatus Amulumruptor caecigallinarius]
MAENPRETDKLEGWRWWLWLVLMLMMGAACVWLPSCTKRVYVPVETVSVRTDTVIVRQTKADSVRVSEHTEMYDTQRDSVAPIMDSLNRVIGIERWHWRETVRTNDTERARLMARIDSLKEVKIDSVMVERPIVVEKIKEVNRLHWWQYALMLGGVIALSWLAHRAWMKYGIRG